MTKGLDALTSLIFVAPAAGGLGITCVLVIKRCAVSLLAGRVTTAVTVRAIYSAVTVIVIAVAATGFRGLGRRTDCDIVTAAIPGTA